MFPRCFFILLYLMTAFCRTKTDADLTHECGFALVRLRKPLHYYEKTYAQISWGAYTVCSLIEEQRNRGRDGAGIAVMKFDMPPGEPYIKRIRNAEAYAIDTVLNTVLKQTALISYDMSKDTHTNEVALKKEIPFLGEIYLGHVRYGTHAGNDISFCQPYIYKSSTAAEYFALAGNFNITNAKELSSKLVSYGVTPTSNSDTHLVLNLIGYHLKQEQIRRKQLLEEVHRTTGTDENVTNIDMVRILHDACAHMDGGYLFAGFVGNGDAFVCRDPAGIRPGFFYSDDEVIAAASERTALMNTFTVQADKIQEIKPGHVLLIRKDGSFMQYQFANPLPLRQCSFERIYFSKVNDAAIYQERKRLGKNIAARIVDAVGDDIAHTVFTYIPNSGESAFMGLIEELQRLVGNTIPIRTEKLVHKNQHVRTFITNDRDRGNLVARLYSTTQGIITPADTLVVIDDSIVRGTTLRESIIKELIYLQPKRIIFVSSAPPVLYPDCYGIDMSQLSSFIAFQAAVALCIEKGNEYILDAIKENCITQESFSADAMINHLQELYSIYSIELLETKIAELIRPLDVAWPGDISVIYQSIEGLHDAMPHHTGDWYFTGHYPTPGGYKVLNTSYLNWCNGSTERAY